MYKLTRTSDGERLGMTETPIYIKRSENGSYRPCPEPEASGISFAGVPYRLLGREGMEDVETVMLEETDAGAEIMAARQQAEDTDGMLVDQEYRLTLLELGLTE